MGRKPPLIVRRPVARVPPPYNVVARLDGETECEQRAPAGKKDTYNNGHEREKRDDDDDDGLLLVVLTPGRVLSFRNSCAKTFRVVKLAFMRAGGREREGKWAGKFYVS